MHRFKALVISLSVYVLLSPCVEAKSQRDNITCGINKGKPLTNAYGPYDFTNPSHRSKLPIVLGAHFRPEIERLSKSVHKKRLHADIDYTLRAIPNYHRALYAVSKLQKQELRMQVNEEFYIPPFYSARCYFERAIYFKSEDAIVLMLYAMHLQSQEKRQLAQKYYEKALALQTKNPEIHYNAALFYLEVKMLDSARQHANLAYQYGYPLPGLRMKLEQLDK